jgi:hypothetical protein
MQQSSAVLILLSTTIQQCCAGSCFTIQYVARCRSTTLGSVLLAGAAIRLFGWDIARPEMCTPVNMAHNMYFVPRLGEEECSEVWWGWQCAVEHLHGVDRDH